MKKITLITLMLITVLGYAQIGINTNTPDTSKVVINDMLKQMR